MIGMSINLVTTSNRNTKEQTAETVTMTIHLRENSALHYSKQCHHCKKLNYFKSNCRAALKGKKQVSESYNTNLDSSSEDCESFDIDGLSLDTSEINAVSETSMKGKEELHCTVTVNGKALELKVDTGVKGSVISADAFKLVKN